eukprot:COSAG03_NODE_17128_length_383_cov_1.454225_1_plen_38_part_01
MRSTRASSVAARMLTLLLCSLVMPPRAAVAKEILRSRC